MNAKWMGIGAIISGTLSMMASLVSSPDYRGPVTIALVFGGISIAASGFVLLASSNKSRWAILLVALPVATFIIDNVGRLLMILGLGGFRILI